RRCAPTTSARPTRCRSRTWPASCATSSPPPPRWRSSSRRHRARHPRATCRTCRAPSANSAWPSASTCATPSAAPRPGGAARLASTAADIARLVPAPTARIVDIGCANGGLLGALQQLGYRRLLGVDPSPQCVENVRQLFGLPAAQGWLLALPAEAAAADVVI